MLTQAEAELLIGMAKRFETPTTISLPPGADLTLESMDFRDPSNMRQALEDFCLFCNIEDTLRFEGARL